MRYQDAFLGSRTEFGEFIRAAIPDLFAGKLRVEGQIVELPDTELDYKVKYDDDLEGGSVTFKVSWDKVVEADENAENTDD
jgi:hypothetical protein